MCSKPVLDEITGKVMQAARMALGEKLDKVVLYGSYARDDYNDESDVDIMVLADIPVEQRWQAYLEISELAGCLSLDYDTIVSIHVVDCATFYQYIDDLPFYINVMKDGVVINA